MPRHARSILASASRPIFKQPDERSAREQSGRVIESIRPRFPVAELLTDRDQTPDRRGRHPSEPGGPLRLVGMVLAERDDEWQDGRRCFRPETMAAIDAVIEQQEVSQALLMAS